MFWERWRSQGSTTSRRRGMLGASRQGRVESYLYAIYISSRGALMPPTTQHVLHTHYARINISSLPPNRRHGTRATDLDSIFF